MKLNLPALEYKGVSGADAATSAPLAPRAARADYTIILRCLLTLAPACYTAWAIFKYSVGMPVIDEWDLTKLFEKFAQGPLTMADLFAQQNEYRQFFPNLIFVMLAWLTKWDVRYAMLVSFLLACLVSFNIYHLCKLTLPVNRTQRWWPYFLANLLIFSPVQFENWLQGQQLIYFMPIACVTTCLLLVYTDRLGPKMKWLLCAVLSFVSTFSAANGLVCWLIIPAALWQVSARAGLRHKRVWLLGWLAGLGGCGALYLHGYRKPPHHPPLAHSFMYPARAWVYFLSLLGGPFGAGRIVLTVITGALLLALFVWVCLRYRLALRQSNDAHTWLCWLILGAYSLLSAGLITIGRAGFGVEQSLARRYTTYTIYLPIALVFLLPLALRGGAQHGAKIWARSRSALLAALLVLHVGIYLAGIKWMSDLRATERHAQACLLLINVAPDNDCLLRLYPDVETLRLRANTLDRLDLLHPRLLTSDHMRDIVATDARAPDVYGALDELAQVGPDEYVASGRAMLPHRGEPADAVLLAWERAGQEPRVLAISDVVLARDFVSALARRGVYGDTRWHKTFSSARLPADQAQLTITAYAFDTRTGSAYKLAGAHVIQRNIVSPLR